MSLSTEAGRDTRDGVGDCPPTRRRDAARSRQLLLTAAQELFAERGYDRTTLREVGERAGLDPALVARYFGSKTALYVAALRAGDHGEVPPDLLAPGRLAGLLARVQSRGAGPVFHGAVQPDDDPQVRVAAAEELHRRLVGPLRDRLAPAPDAQLRAELAVAAVAGIALARSSGTLPALTAAEPEAVAALALRVVEAAAGTAPSP